LFLCFCDLFLFSQGYPDCRDDTIKALQVALNIGMDTRLVLHTPLMFIDKAGTWEMAHRLGMTHAPAGVDAMSKGTELVGVIQEHSHSCYVGDRSTRHEWCAHAPYIYRVGPKHIYTYAEREGEGCTHTHIYRCRYRYRYVCVYAYVYTSISISISISIHLYLYLSIYLP